MSTNKAALIPISAAETAGVLLRLEIWAAQLWILMYLVPWELSEFRKGNEFKQCVDLYEYLLPVEELHRQDKINTEDGEKERTWTLPPGWGSLIHLPFDSWHHPFHFTSLLFYWVHNLIPHFMPNRPTFNPNGCLRFSDWFLTQSEDMSPFPKQPKLASWNSPNIPIDIQGYRPVQVLLDYIPVFYLLKCVGKVSVWLVIMLCGGKALDFRLINDCVF